MTTKEKIRRMVEKLDEDVTYDRVIYHLEVMRTLEARLEEAERGEVIDHDEVFARLLEADEKDQGSLDSGRHSRPSEHPATHRSQRTEDGGGLRRAPKKRRSQA